MNTDRAAVVRRVLTAAELGEPDRVQPAGAGQRNDVWFVETRGLRLIVRLLTDATRLAMETALLARLAGTGLPVADVVWTASEPDPVMIQTQLPGRRLAEADRPAGSRRTVATTLRRIHAISVPSGFGNLRADLTGATSTPSAWFVDRVRSEASAVRGADHDHRVLDRAVEVLEEGRALLDRQQPGLVHGDYQPTNLLVDDDELTGVLDWEAAKSGPPAFDFGWWDWWSVTAGTPWPTEELLAAYDPDGDLDRGEVDAVRRLVVHRIWTRELVAGIAQGDSDRALIASEALTQSSY